MIPAYLLAFLAKHWRPIAFVALILAAFAAGRFATPTKTVTVERIQWKDRVVTQVVEKQAEQKETVKTVVVYRDVIKHTDGSTETKSETRAVTGTQDNTESAATTNTFRDRAPAVKIFRNTTPFPPPVMLTMKVLDPPAGW